jgi:cytidine deaminase
MPQQCGPFFFGREGSTLAAMAPSAASLAPLIAAARAARANAYAPYSNLQVGAALRGAGGAIFAGANVENAAFPQGQCAEASAIGQMISAGERRIAALVVIGGDQPCPPCGGCRQRLAEFAGPELPIHLCATDGRELARATLGELLPLAFTPALVPRGKAKPGA